MFWTVSIPDDAVTVNLAAGTAELHVREMKLLDSYSIPNALGGGPSEPATVTFGFAGTFLDVTSALEWSAQTADFAFASDPAATSTSLHGRIGYEANGVYFQTITGTPAP